MSFFLWLLFFFIILSTANYLVAPIDVFDPLSSFSYHIYSTSDAWGGSAIVGGGDHLNGRRNSRRSSLRLPEERLNKRRQAYR